LPALPFSAAALSAAEKRDYAELSSFRQPFQHLFSLRPALQTSLRQPFRSTPQPLLRLLCSAALCVARGRILGRIRAPCNNFVTTIR
ncbi:hypothetical protein, partial [Cupriavidus necator]|uniref:hypothetical protein n=1 Tax=Cupriavidus necator TaxID=106590 RepID=UPI001C40A1E2